MFSKTITSSSRFLMMSQSAQNLYFHLGMNADDDGFCEHFTIMRMTESKPDDLKVLQTKGFVKLFDEKVLVITEWKENNYIQKDRYTPSKYLEIYKQEIKELVSGQPNGNQMATKCIQDVSKMDTQVRIGKVRIGNNNTVCFEKFWSLYPKKISKKKTMEIWNKIKPDKNLLEVILKAIEVAKKTDQWKRGYIPHPTTYLNQERWNDKFTTEDFESDDNNQITIIK